MQWSEAAESVLIQQHTKQPRPGGPLESGYLDSRLWRTGNSGPAVGRGRSRGTLTTENPFPTGTPTSTVCNGAETRSSADRQRPDTPALAHRARLSGGIGS